MFKRNKKISYLPVLFFILAGISPLSAEDQSWFANSATFKIDQRFSLYFTQEGRYREIPFMDVYLKNLQGGLIFRLPHDFYIAALYKREHADLFDKISDENRFTMEAGWKTGLIETVFFDLRFRFEVREFEQEIVEDHLRFRLRLRFKWDAYIGSLHIKPFIATEIFGKNKVYTVQRNRLYIGSVFPFSENLGFVLNYIRQDTRGAETIHILNSGFELKF